MKFRKKKEVLEYLGKNEKDVRLLDRMMLRGELVRENGMYILIDDKKALIEEIKNLKEQLSKVSNPDLDNELYEAKVQREYYQNLYENEVLDKQNRIRKCFQWIKAKYPKADWEEFRDWVMGD